VTGDSRGLGWPWSYGAPPAKNDGRRYDCPHRIVVPARAPSESPSDVKVKREATVRVRVQCGSDLQVLEIQSFRFWVTTLDDFRNWLDLGLQPAKCDENGCAFRIALLGAARSK
jgi:hypothetical protein